MGGVAITRTWRATAVHRNVTAIRVGASDAPRQEYSVGVFADDVAWLVICSISRNRGGNIAPDSYVGAVT
jgi:hypothetical protein